MESVRSVFDPRDAVLVIFDDADEPADVPGILARG
jgi:hypothetical protein